MRIMSFNIRYSEFTPERIDLVIKTVKKYSPDSVGFQEATDAWMEVLSSRLADEYNFVGCGRNADRMGEASPIFYRKSRFKILEENTLWMCDTPNVPGSKVASSTLPRIFTYALLKDLQGGKKFVHFNAHLEHKSEEARVSQIKVLLDYTKRFDNENIPCVLTGDFNCREDGDCYAEIMKYGLASCAKIAKKSKEGETFHGYGTAAITIDFIFLREALASVSEYKVCDDTYTNPDGSIAYPSDHYPIIADIEFLK